MGLTGSATCRLEHQRKLQSTSCKTVLIFARDRKFDLKEQLLETNYGGGGRGVCMCAGEVCKHTFLFVIRAEIDALGTFFAGEVELFCFG